MEPANHPVSLSQFIAHGMSQVTVGTDTAQQWHPLQKHFK